MEKTGKNLWMGATAIVAIVLAIVGIIVVKNNSGEKPVGEGESSSQESSSFADELTNVDVEIEYGDYDAMKELASDIQNGRATGKVVKIDGLVSHPMSFYSVVEPNEDETSTIGTRFVIEDETGYPEDEDHIIITGKVIELESLVYVIKTTSDFIEIQE